MKLDSAFFTTEGGREENQDSVGILENDNSGIYIVADGLGGHKNGKMASECVVSCLTEAWKTRGATADEDWLKTNIGIANTSLLDLQKQEKCVMKSTVVALTVEDNQAKWAHTGDSRLYYIHKDEIWKITKDHSVAYMKYLSGEITREQIGTDEDQSSLLRALGSPTRYEPDTDSCTIETGDAFLLCCDGMWEYVLDEEILIDYFKAQTAQEWILLLLLRAMDRIPPSNDNLSVVTVIVRD